MLNKLTTQKPSFLLFICSVMLWQVTVADTVSNSVLDALSAEASHTDMRDETPTADTKEPDVVTIDSSKLEASDELSDKITRQLQDLLGKTGTEDVEDTEKGIEKVVSSALLEGNKIEDIKGAVVESLAKIAAENKEISAEKVDKAKKVLTEITSSEKKNSENKSKSLPQTVTVKKGESLFKIALKVYGDGNMYLRLYQANKATIQNPDLLSVGQVLTIPTFNE